MSSGPHIFDARIASDDHTALEVIFYGVVFVADLTDLSLTQDSGTPPTLLAVSGSGSSERRAGLDPAGSTLLRFATSGAIDPTLDPTLVVGEACTIADAFGSRLPPQTVSVEDSGGGGVTPSPPSPPALPDTAATPNTLVKRDADAGIFAGSLTTNGLLSPDGTDIYIQPGLADDDADGFNPNTVRNTVFWGGVGNPDHQWQAGAITYNTSLGLVRDEHGVGISTAGADQGKVSRWVCGFGGPNSNGYPFAISVDVNFEGAYSFNLGAYATAALAVNIQSANTFGFAIRDASNSSRAAFTVTSKGISICAEIDSAQTGSIQLLTQTQTGTPAASRVWLWSDGTVLRGKNHAGDSIITLRVDAVTGNTVIDTGASVASTGKKVSYFVDGASFLDVNLAGGNSTLQTAGTLALFAQTMTTVVSGGYWRVQSPGIYLDGPITQIRDASASTVFVDIASAAGSAIKLGRAAHTPRQVLTVSSGALTVDMSLSNHVQITYSGSFTLALSNLKDGAHYAIHLINNVGAATLSYPSSIKVPGGSIAQPSQTSGKHDTIIGVCDGTNIYGELKLAYA